jgi:hypothetical protein
MLKMFWGIFTMCCFFNLCSNGGAQWTKEFESYEKEEADQWTTVFHGKKKQSYANVVHRQNPLSGATRSSIWMKRSLNSSSNCGQASIFNRISWPNEVVCSRNFIEAVIFTIKEEFRAEIMIGLQRRTGVMSGGFSGAGPFKVQI